MGMTYDDGYRIIDEGTGLCEKAGSFYLRHYLNAPSGYFYAGPYFDPAAAYRNYVIVMQEFAAHMAKWRKEF